MSDTQLATVQSRALSGGRVLVEHLRAQGVDRIFCVPGESFLDVLDALHDFPDMQVVVSRHEGAAANMAEADGKLTGRPGICFVTRGPGATHASVGVHTAMQDSTPMILFIGQVKRRFLGREAFQEVDLVTMFTPLTKWAAEIDSAARIPEFVGRAFHTALSGRPGPVVLVLPEDVLEEVSEVACVKPCRAAVSAPHAEDVDALMAELQRARRPVLLLGGSGWTPNAVAEMRAFAESNDVPVVTSFRRQDLFDNTDDLYVGHLSIGISPHLAEHVRDADLIIAVGTRLSEATSDSYKLVASPYPQQRFVHVHADPEELGRVFRPDVSINSGMPAFAAALASRPPVADPPWRSWRQQLRRDYVAFSSTTLTPADHGGVDLTSVVGHLSESLPDDAIICNGAGNYTVWVHRFYKYRRFRTELAPTSGAMGYGVGASIAAALRHPDRTVVSFAGDGCFLMYPQELGTAIQYGAAVIFLIVANGMYGTIRMHQERRYPGRVSNTDLPGPDFVMLAKSLGAYSERVERPEDFAPAFARAQASGIAAVLELRVDPYQITPNARLRR
jgi:acetolactate synthase-1/2/3 large subunit